MALVCALTVFAGFAPTYYLGRSGLPPLSPLIHVHAVVFTIWIGVLVIQTSLVTARRTDLHRRIGVAAVVLAAVIVVLGFAAAVDSLRRGLSQPDIDPRVLFAIPISSIVTFAALVAAAILYRRDSATRKRLMLLATVSLLSAAIGRIVLLIGHLPVMTLFVFTDLFVLAAVLYDLVSRRRIHPANLWGGALIIFKPLFVLLAMTPGWLAIADALR